MNTQYKKNKHSGVTLIELMVAMFLGLIVAGAAIELFTSNKQTYRLEGSLSELQDTGRFIVKKMTEEIRMGGYFGCSSRGDSLNINDMGTDPSPYPLDTINGINGSEADGPASWTPALPGMLSAALVTSDTDTITVQRVEECSAQLLQNSADTAGTLTVHAPHNCSLIANSPVLVTDCENADIFQIDNGAPANSAPSDSISYAASGNLQNAYESSNAELHRIFSTTFGIGTSVIDPTETALWMTSWNPDTDGAMTLANDFTTTELAIGVEDLQILYGIGAGGGVNIDDDYATNYVTADNVADWSLVRSVRINILLHSDDNVTSTPRGINFNGVLVNDPDDAASDQRLRMIFTSTISLRNRLK